MKGRSSRFGEVLVSMRVGMVEALLPAVVRLLMRVQRWRTVEG
jgi:hypothetical protein